MRKVVAGAVAAAALAWAGGAQADHHTADAKKKDNVSQPGPMSPRDTPPAATDRTSREMRNAERGDSPAAAAGARDSDDRRAEVKHPLFDGKENYDMDGKVKSASSDSITIERKDGLPPATLKVGANTKVEVDGKRSSAANLTPGQDVKASFNMSGDKAEAVEIKADQRDPKDRRELGEQRRENQKERSEQMREQQKDRK